MRTITLALSIGTSHAKMSLNKINRLRGSDSSVMQEIARQSPHDFPLWGNFHRNSTECTLRFFSFSGRRTLACKLDAAHPKTADDQGTTRQAWVEAA
jgi:hypothetical protein